jgi:hypothetical protein
MKRIQKGDNQIFDVGGGWLECGHKDVAPDPKGGFNYYAIGLLTKNPDADCFGSYIGTGGQYMVSLYFIDNGKGPNTRSAKHIETAIIEVKAGLSFNIDSCKGAGFALFRDDDKPVFKNIARAWNFSKGKLIEVKNLKGVSCVNPTAGL